MDIDMTGGLVFGLLGSLIGLIGAAIGCYYSIKNTRGPKERKYMIKLVFAATLLVSILLIGVFTMGFPAAHWLMLPFFALVLPAMIYFGNKRQRAIRAEESNR